MLRPLLAATSIVVLTGVAAYAAAPLVADTTRIDAELSGAVVQLLPGPPQPDGARTWSVEVLTDETVDAVELLVGDEVVAEADELQGGRALLTSDAAGDVRARVSLEDGATVDSAIVVAAPPGGRSALLADVGDARTIADAADRLGLPAEEVGALLGLDADDLVPGSSLRTDSAVVRWDGPARLVDGLLAVEPPDVSRVFVYVSGDDTVWHRVPALDGTAIDRSNDGTFDLRGQLPALVGETVSVEVWRADIDVALVGTSRGTLTATSSAPSGPQEATGLSAMAFDVGLTGRLTLGFIERPGVHGVDEALTESTRIDPDRAEELAFRWSSDVPGVTHVVWQAYANTAPGTVSVTDPTVVRYGVSTPDDDGRFVFRPPTPLDLSSQLRNEPIETVLVDHAALLGADPPRAGQLSRDGPDTSARYMGGAYFATSGVGAWVVRALAFAGDTYLGIASNDVTVYVQEARPTEIPPPGAYRLEMTVHPPEATDPTVAGCYLVTAIDPEKRAAATGDTAHEFRVLDAIIARHGQYICWGICYRDLQIYPPGTLASGLVTTWSVSNSCGSGGGGIGAIPTDLGSAFVGVAIIGYDLAADTYNGAKQWVVDAVVEITFCEEVASSEDCSAAANYAVTAAMMSVGLPPSAPDRQALIDGAKGDLSAALADLAADNGVPCGLLSSVDGATDTGLTCEAMADQIVQRAYEKIQESVRASADHVGFPFPPGVTVMPDPRAFPQPGVVELTMVAEPGERLGPGCVALVNSRMTWDATGLFATRLPFHQHPFDKSNGDWWIANGTYGGTMPPTAVELPVPAEAGGSATVTFTLPTTPPFADQTVTRYREVNTVDGPYNTTDSWTVEGVHVVQREGALLQVDAASTCAGSASGWGTVVPNTTLLAYTSEGVTP